MSKALKVALTVIATAVTLVAVVKLVGDHKQQNEWEQSRGTTTVYVSQGETLWCIAEEYKPSWMDTREYIQEVKTLNGMSSSTVYAGDRLTVYTETAVATNTTAIAGSRYTLYGYYNDGMVITEDGQSWIYDTQLDSTPVVVVFDDNSTPNDIYDDVIINILED